MPSNFYYNTDVPGFIDLPFDFNTASNHRKYAKRLQIRVGSQWSWVPKFSSYAWVYESLSDGRRPSLSGYKLMCASFAASLSGILCPEAYPALDMIHIAIDPPARFAIHREEFYAAELPENALLDNLVTVLRQLPIENRMISIRPGEFPIPNAHDHHLQHPEQITDYRTTKTEELIDTLARLDDWFNPV